MCVCCVFVCLHVLLKPDKRGYHCFELLVKVGTHIRHRQNIRTKHLKREIASEMNVESHKDRKAHVC